MTRRDLLALAAVALLAACARPIDVGTTARLDAIAPTTGAPGTAITLTGRFTPQTTASLCGVPITDLRLVGDDRVLLAPGLGARGTAATTATGTVPDLPGGSICPVALTQAGVPIGGSTVAFSVDAAVPAAPTSVVAVPSDRRITVRFDLPFDGGTPITDLEIQRDGGAWTSTGRTTPPIVVTGLTNGTTYTLAVRARNAVGTSASSDPVVASPRFVFASIAAGFSHTVALDDLGRAWAWGSGGFGVRGDGSTADAQSTPVAVDLTPVVAAGATRLTDIAAGSFHTLAIDDLGRGWAWGRGVAGQRGDGSLTAVQTTPVAVDLGPVVSAGATHLTAISAGDLHSLALDDLGRAWAWGNNGTGELGLGVAGGAFPVPAAVVLTPITSSGGSRLTAVSAGYNHSLALDDLGRAWAWGSGFFGQLGNGSDLAVVETPVAVDLAPITATGGSRLIAIAAGDWYSVALDDLGRIWTWGTGGGPASGADTVPRAVDLTPVTANGGGRITALAAGGNHVLALDDLGRAWAWGNDGNGELGNGDPIGGFSAVLVPVEFDAVVALGATRFTGLAAGYAHSLAIDDLGRAWAWGGGWLGQRGDGNLEGERGAPVAVLTP